MARRDGQIVTRGKRKWLVRWYVGAGSDGKRRYHSKLVHGTKKDAQAKLNEVLRNRDLGTYVEPTRMTLDAYLDRWLTDGACACSPRTRESYRWLLAKYVRPRIGSLRLDQLSPLDVQSIVSRMIEGGYSSRTVRMALAVLRQSLKQAVRWRLLSRSPGDGIELPKEASREMRALSAEEARAIRTAARKLAAAARAEVESARTRRERERWAGEAARCAQAAVVFDVLLTTGLRPGEALGLRWRDLDLEAGKLTVQQALTWDVATDKEGKRHHVPVLREPKTAGSRRSLPIGPTLARSLVSQRSVQAERAMKLGTSYDRSLDLVFANEVGRPLDERNLAQRYFAPAVEKAKIAPGLRLYDLRHTCATQLLAGGAHVKAVSERLGHSSAKMTLDVYAHVLPGEQEKATAILEAALLGSGT
jgi:integrase